MTIEKITEDRIKIEDTKIIFNNPVDTGFGTSITFLVEDEKNEKFLNEFVSDCGLKDKKAPGVKSYTNETTGETTKQFTVKTNDRTIWFNKDGSKIEDIEEVKKVGFGSVISVVINKFYFDNKFGKGKGTSANAILVKSSNLAVDPFELFEGEIENQKEIDGKKDEGLGITGTDLDNVPF